MYINRTTDLDNPGAVGLFGLTGTASVIRKIGLVSVDIAGVNGVGGLVGRNEGAIIASYAAGDLSGGSEVGGLVGVNHETISASYATGAVSGDDSVGGLAGRNSGTISASYATSNVSGRSYVGGLIGSNSGGHLVAASYATGPVSGIGNVGGLIGSNSGTVIGGFWDTQTSGLTTGVGNGDSAGVVGKNTAELQATIGSGYTGIYSVWVIDFDNADQDFDPMTGVDDFWDFGSSSQYPVLKVDFDGDGSISWQEFGNQVRSRPPLIPTPTTTVTLARTPTPTLTSTLEPTSTPTPTATPVPTGTSIPIPTPNPTFMPTATSAPAATAMAAEPTPPAAAESEGGACGSPAGPVPTGAAAINLFLLLAPLGMVGGLRWRSRRRREDDDGITRG